VGERKGTAAWTVQKYSERGKHLLCHPSLMSILCVRMYNQYYCSVYGLQYAYKMSGSGKGVHAQNLQPMYNSCFRPYISYCLQFSRTSTSDVSSCTNCIFMFVQNLETKINKPDLWGLSKYYFLFLKLSGLISFYLSLAKWCPWFQVESSQLLLLSLSNFTE
jgi:hypothetical protein